MSYSEILLVMAGPPALVLMAVVLWMKWQADRDDRAEREQATRIAPAE